MTVLLVDDHPLVCSGLKTILEPQYSVIGMVHHGADVLGMIERHHPDIVLMDLSLPGRNGLSLVQEITKGPHPPRVLVVTMHADPIYVEEVMQAGAGGYILKTAQTAELRRAVAELLAGHWYTSPELRGHPRAVPRTIPGVGGHALDGALQEAQALTERQRDVLRRVGRGCSSQEIAAQLGLSTKAIEYHRSSIRHALGVTSQGAFYRFAVRYAMSLEQPHGAAEGGAEH